MKKNVLTEDMAPGQNLEEVYSFEEGDGGRGELQEARGQAAAMERRAVVAEGRVQTLEKVELRTRKIVLRFENMMPSGEF